MTVRGPRRSGAALIGLAASLTLAVGAGLTLAGVPASWLVAGLVAGTGCALRWRRTAELPAAVTVGSEAVIGAALGALLEPDTLASLSGSWPVVALVVAATLGLSLATAAIVVRLTGVDPPTATFGMLAGGAPGILAVSRDTGADVRLVALMQFGRVALIVLTAPALAIAFGHGAGGSGGAAGGLGAVGSPSLGAVAIAAACTAAGALAGTRLRIPGGALLIPLALTAGVTLLGGTAVFPAPVIAAALAVLGLGIGLGFDRDTLARSRHVVGAALGGSVLLLIGCAGLGALLVALAGVDPLTAYLATTPGGFSSVLATASQTGAQVTVVLSLQTLRLLAMVVVAPLVAWRVGAVRRPRAARRPRGSRPGA